jgi:hypothetical protein
MNGTLQTDQFRYRLAVGLELSGEQTTPRLFMPGRLAPVAAEEGGDFVVSNFATSFQTLFLSNLKFQARLVPLTADQTRAFVVSYL